MVPTRLNFVNQRGIPALETISNNLTTTAETFVFNQHPYVSNYFQGLLIVKVSGTPTAPSTAVPIRFSTEGVANSDVPVCNAAGTALTTETWPGDGVFLFFFDRTTNILRMLTTI